MGRREKPRRSLSDTLPLWVLAPVLAIGAAGLLATFPRAPDERSSIATDVCQVLVMVAVDEARAACVERQLEVLEKLAGEVVLARTRQRAGLSETVARDP